MGQLHLNESIPRKGDFMIEERGGWDWLSLSLCDISLVVLPRGLPWVRWPSFGGRRSPLGRVVIFCGEEVKRWPSRFWP